MTATETFILGVLSTLAGSAVICGVGWTLRAGIFRRLRAWCEVAADIRAVYDNGDTAQADIEAECHRSTTVKHVSTYNTTFVAEGTPEQTALFRVLSTRPPGKPSDLRFLNLDPDSPFLDVKASELNSSPSELRKRILDHTSMCSDVLGHLGLPPETVRVLPCCFLPVFRLTVLDHCAFVGFHRPQRLARWSPVLKIRRESELYGALNRFFDTLWDYSFSAKRRPGSLAEGGDAAGGP